MYLFDTPRITRANPTYYDLLLSPLLFKCPYKDYWHDTCQSDQISLVVPDLHTSLYKVVAVGVGGYLSIYPPYELSLFPLSGCI